MSDARSLTAMSENDYEAIATAVMETARGRWFMGEYARRNRHADTTQLLTAIEQLQRACGAAAPQAPPRLGFGEAADLIMDLRTDLERIRGNAEEPSSGLARRVEGAAGAILAAAESIQEAAWGLREAGANDELCDLLDRRTTEIYGATAIVEGTAHQIGKIADTIAMLDSSLRAFAEGSHEAPGPAAVAASPVAMLLSGLRDAAPLPDYDDVEVIEVNDKTRASLGETATMVAPPTTHRRPHSVQVIDEDLVFADTVAAESPAEPARPALAATSEVDLRALDGRPATEKLAYFA